MNKPLTLRYGIFATFSDLFCPQKLQQLDNYFLAELKNHNQTLYQDLLDYRQGKTFTPVQLSELLIACAKPLEDFIAELFGIEKALETSRQQTLAYNPIFSFKKWFVMRRAKRRLLRDENLPPFATLNQWLQHEISSVKINKQMLESTELKIACYADKLLEDTATNADNIEQLTQWCIQAIKTKEGRAFTANWISFKLPQHKDYQRLIPLTVIKGDPHQRQQSAKKPLRQRDGFKLSDRRMSLPSALDEVHYCIYCHKNDGDFCSKGFPQKKGAVPHTLRRNPLDNILTGCPLDQKISEMHVLKRDGHTIAALAMIMIDNPMCPVTGHRICNDCMKACIYQKQDAVNIPEAETRILSDVLTLPWGVEIYDLLTRWLPLRQQQWIVKPYNAFKVLIAGMGPAGFTMAHHLLMEGFAVVGVDGVKIEPLDETLIKKPIYRFDDICDALDERTMAGFGGVAEYGITVRWDKKLPQTHLPVAVAPSLLPSIWWCTLWRHIDS